MLENQLSRLAKIQIPAVMAIIVLVSTIVHYLSTPTPAETPLLSLFSYDILVAVLIAPLMYHCLKTLGTVKGLLFFFTVSFFMGSLEALWVFLGKLGILGDAYDYPMGGLWFFGIPLYIAVGWFIWVYVLYVPVNKLIKGAPQWKACLCGLMALCIDIWMDPAVVNASLVSNSPNAWNWAQTNAPKLLTVPLYNFIGWFLSVATLVFVYEKTWARIGMLSRKAHPLREIFIRLIGGWIIFVVGTKAIQLGLEQLFPGLDLLTLGLKSGGTMTAVKTGLLFVVPLLLITSLVIAILRAIRDKERRKDIWLMLGFAATIAVNLQTAYSLQLHFPGTYLIYLVVFAMLLPLAMMLWYLTRPPEKIVSSEKILTV